MPTMCCIKNCKRQNDDPDSLHLNFFKVPKDAEKRKKWQASLNRYCEMKIELRDNLRICAQHFNKECFSIGGLCQRIRLKNNAVPTIFENYNEYSVTEQDQGKTQLETFFEDDSYNRQVSKVNSLHNIGNYHNFSTSYSSEKNSHAPAPQNWLQKLQELKAVCVFRSKKYEKNVCDEEAEISGSEDNGERNNMESTKVEMRLNKLSFSPDNIIQMTENDFTTPTFHIDPEMLPSNKYRFPDGRIVTINANSNVPGGYSATIGGVTDNGITSKMPMKLSTNPAILRSKCGSRNKNTKPKNTSKRYSNVSKTRELHSNRYCDLDIPVEWYRYNLIDAMEILENSLVSLNKLNQEAITTNLETRSDSEICTLNKSLDRLLGTTAEKFCEIRENLNEELRQFLEKKQGYVSTDYDDDDDDVEMLSNTDNNGDPKFIDEYSLGLTEDNEVGLENQRHNRIKRINRSFTPKITNNMVIEPVML